MTRFSDGPLLQTAAGWPYDMYGTNSDFYGESH